MRNIDELITKRNTEESEAFDHVGLATGAEKLEWERTLADLEAEELNPRRSSSLRSPACHGHAGGVGADT